jgi:hypothetical protein
MREQLRLIVCGIVLTVIAAASIIEPPGVAVGIAYVLVIASMMLTIWREGKRLRGK